MSTEILRLLPNINCYSNIGILCSVHSKQYPHIRKKTVKKNEFLLEVITIIKQHCLGAILTYPGGCMFLALLFGGRKCRVTTQPRSPSQPLRTAGHWVHVHTFPLKICLSKCLLMTLEPSFPLISTSNMTSGLEIPKG